MSVNLVEHEVKGIARCLLDADLQGEPLHVHITEIGPGERAHPPHRHGGYEAFYILEGSPTLEVDEETFLLGPNQAAVFDPQKLHGLVNQSDGPARYIVILVKP
jgi:XRE family transcriptional regulator, regulator of sulfur utilization